MRSYIIMNDCSIKHIRDLRPGDRLFEGVTVISVTARYGPRVRVGPHLMGVDTRIYLKHKNCGHEHRGSWFAEACWPTSRKSGPVLATAQEIADVPRCWRDQYYIPAGWAWTHNGLVPFTQKRAMTDLDPETVAMSRLFNESNETIACVLNAHARIVDGRITITLPDGTDKQLAMTLMNLFIQMSIPTIRSPKSDNLIIVAPYVDLRTWTGETINVFGWRIPTSSYIPLVVEPADDGLYYELEIDNNDDVTLADGTVVFVPGPRRLEGEIDFTWITKR